jgi:hypothetical protein
MARGDGDGGLNNSSAAAPSPPLEPMTGGPALSSHAIAGSLPKLRGVRTGSPPRCGGGLL